MATSNPAFSRSLAFSPSNVATPDARELDELYSRPSASSASTGRMTYEDMGRLKMKDLKVVTKLLGDAGGTEEEDEDDEDLYPNE
ncbi:MAG: hypothetical protein HN760_02010 [Microbacteriaceae bacterium]|nr:hypothetical protein [Microbacteriaceae bacterium]